MTAPATNGFGNWIAARVDALGSTDSELMLRLLKTYFRRFRRRFALIALMILVISATTAVVPLFVKYLVNQILVEPSGFLFVPLFFAIVAIFVVKGAATYCQTVLSARISNDIVADVRTRMFDHLLRQRVRFFSRYGTDELLMRFNQGATGFNSILTTVLVNGIRDLWMVLALVSVMVWEDAVLAALSLIMTPAIYYGVVALIKRIRRLVELELAGHAELNKHIREIVQGIEVIKSFNLEAAAARGAHDVVARLRQQANRIAALQSAPVPLLDTVGGIAVGIAVLYAGIRITGGDYDAGTFMSFITALLLAADPARRLSQMRVALRSSFVMMKLVIDLLEDDDREEHAVRTAGSAGTAAPSGKPPAIAFEDVSFAYSGAGSVLDGFDLSVASGETVALVGPSGAGKSTVFKLLLKFYDPTRGTIRIDGTDIADIDTAAHRRLFGYVGQSNFIFTGSIRDNLALMDPSVPLEQIEYACAEVGLDGYVSALPARYDTPVGELGNLISGGQAQRLNLARAIVRNAPALLLDEVTSALDAESEERIKQALRRMGRSKTILVIAHRLSTVKEADRIALMRDGRIVDIGTHEELVSRNSYYERLVSLQFA